MGEVMGEIIRIENLTYSYAPNEGEEKREVLHGISLSIEKGSFVAVLGHNGSGKSTLAKHLNAVLLPESGNVYVNGMDTKDEEKLMDIRKTVGMVFQNPDNQIVSNIVEEDVAFAPENMGCPTEEIRRRVDEALKSVGMYKYREHAPHLLSGGQKQRVAIAGVLAMEPECVVFDEATAMLDPGGRAGVIKIIEKLRDRGVTVVLITHHMNEAIGADRVIVMSDGRVVMDGVPRDIFTRVEELRGYGLTVPETTEIMYELNKQGFNLPLSALSASECADAVYAAMTM
jgi:energy-coupling factor transport system ATP-binding protein